jgi:anthraniloyl-CoA monooxygenase
MARVKVTILGAGPGGLGAALALRARGIDAEITVIDRRTAASPRGYGVVLPRTTFDRLSGFDRTLHQSVDAVEVVHKGARVPFSAPSFEHICSIARGVLLDELERLCRAAAIMLRLGEDVRDPRALAERSDLLIAADGFSGVCKTAWQSELKQTQQWGTNHYLWAGSAHTIPQLVMAFAERDGLPYVMHKYRYGQSASTVIVELPTATWQQVERHPALLDHCADVFADELEGARIVTETEPRWQRMCVSRLERWFVHNVVFVGDAAHTVHFCQGAGTTIAFMDAWTLADALSGPGVLTARLQRFSDARVRDLRQILDDSVFRMRGLESVGERFSLSPYAFAQRLIV